MSRVAGPLACGCWTTRTAARTTAFNHVDTLRKAVAAIRSIRSAVVCNQRAEAYRHATAATTASKGDNTKQPTTQHHSLWSTLTCAGDSKVTNMIAASTAISQQPARVNSRVTHVPGPSGPWCVGVLVLNNTHPHKTARSQHPSKPRSFHILNAWHNSLSQHPQCGDLQSKPQPGMKRGRDDPPGGPSKRPAGCVTAKYSRQEAQQ